MTCLGRLLFIDNNSINFLHNWYYLHHYENTLGPLTILHMDQYVLNILHSKLDIDYVNFKD
jgi:hypothetical protein